MESQQTVETVQSHKEIIIASTPQVAHDEFDPYYSKYGSQTRLSLHDRDLKANSIILDPPSPLQISDLDNSHENGINTDRKYLENQNNSYDHPLVGIGIDSFSSTEKPLNNNSLLDFSVIYGEEESPSTSISRRRNTISSLDTDFDNSNQRRFPQYSSTYMQYNPLNSWNSLDDITNGKNSTQQASDGVNMKYLETFGKRFDDSFRKPKIHESTEQNCYDGSKYSSSSWKSFGSISNNILHVLSPTWIGWQIEPSETIKSFQTIKVIYIFLLIPYQITISSGYIKNHPSYASYDLKYEHYHGHSTDHGLEYMMGLLLIAGYLSYTTTKPDFSSVEFMKKKLLRLLPSYYFGAIPLTLLCIIMEGINYNASDDVSITCIIGQFILECLTLGSWNPLQLIYTRNRPLWFISVLMMFHYTSPYYFPWLKHQNTSNLIILILCGIFTRLVVIVLTLVAILIIYPKTYYKYSRVPHIWAVAQILVPYIGALLGEFTTRIGKLTWNKTSIWRATDLITFLTFSTCFFPSAYFLVPSDSNQLEFMLNALFSIGDILVWPLFLVGIYLHSHDISTFSWINQFYPKLFNDGQNISYPLYLMHWPIILLLKQSKALDEYNPVSVIVAYATCLVTALFVDRYVIAPVEIYLEGKIHLCDDYIAMLYERKASRQSIPNQSCGSIDEGHDESMFGKTDGDTEVISFNHCITSGVFESPRTNSSHTVDILSCGISPTSRSLYEQNLSATSSPTTAFSRKNSPSRRPSYESDNDLAM